MKKHNILMLAACVASGEITDEKTISAYLFLQGYGNRKKCEKAAKDSIEKTKEGDKDV